MIGEDFINIAYKTMERGFPEFRKRKRQNARRSVIKNFFYLFKNKTERSNRKLFLMHPKPEVQKIFADAEILDTEDSTLLKKALIYLQMGYLLSSNSLQFWFARKGYKYLQRYFNAANITIINCGPSLLSPFLAKMCEDKNDGSSYYIIQHGLYQLDYRPYDFEFDISASNSVIWSSLLAKNYLALGMEAEKIHVLPTYLFKEMQMLNISRKVLIIGESLNKINPDFDEAYGDFVINAVEYIKQNTSFDEFHYKKHPRALPSIKLDTSLESIGVIENREINLQDYGLVIGAVSTLMIEALAQGCRVLQLSLDKFSSINVMNYSLFSSVENIGAIKEIESKLEKLLNLKKNYIDSEFLMVRQKYEEYYLSIIK